MMKKQPNEETQTTLLKLITDNSNMFYKYTLNL
jgi:hypothetical protein